MIDVDGVPVAHRGVYRRGLYRQIFLEAFAKVIEGICPNCGYHLRPATGYCWECCCNWSAYSDPDATPPVQVIRVLDRNHDDRKAHELDWSLVALPMLDPPSDKGKNPQ